MLRFAFCAVVFVATSASAFDIDGLSTGQSREKAIAQLERYGLKITSEKDDHVLATAAGRLYSLNFCKGSLVSVQKNLEPTFNTFIELTARFHTLYGAPLSVAPKLPDPTSYAPAHSLSISWRDKAELITATHKSFSSNNQTDVTYDARNACFQYPLLRQ